VLTDVAVVAICTAMAAAGVRMVVRWGGERAERRLPVPRHLVALAATAAGSGLLAAGAGGRLVMGLLAITSPEADGSTTEAGATIGEVTLGGTVGFFVFAGIGAGLLMTTLFLVTGALLPRGRAGGALLGLLLFVLLGSRADPIRTDNFDFDLVGPDLLSLACFTALAALQGMLTVALAGHLGVPPLQLPRVAGRVVVGAVALVALPGFLAAAGDILGG
jgi:hypothetical protein